MKKFKKKFIVPTKQNLIFSISHKSVHWRSIFDQSWVIKKNKKNNVHMLIRVHFSFHSESKKSLKKYTFTQFQIRNYALIL